VDKVASQATREVRNKVADKGEVKRVKVKEPAAAEGRRVVAGAALAVAIVKG
jgi:hypothetical protein